MSAWPVTIIGLGAIGSNTARVLSQLGTRNFTLFDDDTVGEENLATQCYRASDVGLPKATALNDVLTTFLPNLEIKPRIEPYSDQHLEGIVVLGTDTMESRSIVWESVKESTDVVLLVDGRTAGEELHVHTIRPAYPTDIGSYEASLIPDDQAAHVPCTASAAAHAQFVIAGMIATQIVRWVNRQPYPRFLLVNLRTVHLMTGELVTFEELPIDV
jgi:molybdopterin/thiamine biosynthesis adenylyltransferase